LTGTYIFGHLQVHLAEGGRDLSPWGRPGRQAGPLSARAGNDCHLCDRG